jgi:hypothetical protein
MTATLLHGISLMHAAAAGSNRGGSILRHGSTTRLPRPSRRSGWRATWQESWSQLAAPPPAAGRASWLHRVA